MTIEPPATISLPMIEWSLPSFVYPGRLMIEDRHSRPVAVQSLLIKLAKSSPSRQRMIAAARPEPQGARQACAPALNPVRQ